VLAFRGIHTATKGLIAVPLDPLLAIFSVAGGYDVSFPVSNSVVSDLTPHGFIVANAQQQPHADLTV